MKLNFSDYYDKVLGCFVGKNIGGTLGAPFECYRGEYNIKGFMQDISVPIPNDDIDLQLVWLRAVELEGRRIDSHILAEYWNTSISATIAEYGTGKNNFNMGIFPPISGKLRNPNRNSNGAWIRTEIWACLCAGSPQLATNYAYYDSSVDHAEEGVYSAIFIAAMQAAAFFEKDYFKLIDIALSFIPKDCDVAKAVYCVLDSYGEKKTWQQARKQLFMITPSSFGMIAGYWKGNAEVAACEACPVQEPDPEIPQAVHGHDAPWSVGAILIGLLYGEKEFGKTVCIATDCGEDTDCTAGTAGAIWGIVYGYKAIPAKWKNDCSDKIATWTLRIDANLLLPKTVYELTDRIVRQTPKILENKCKISADFDIAKKSLKDEKDCGYTIEAASTFVYKKNLLDQCKDADIKALLEEHKDTVRIHHMLYNVLIKFDETLVKISEEQPKIINIKFENMVYDPQYFTIRFIDVPTDWTLKNGVEHCVGVEQWHGGSNHNDIDIEFVPRNLKKGKYTLIMEISSNGRMAKSYIPLTFINGSC